MAIGTTAAILGAAAIGGVGSAVAGSRQASAAKSASRAQSKAAMEAARLQAEAMDRQTALGEKALAFQRSTYEQGREDSLPWLEAGQSALKQYRVEMGLADGESGFQATPGYEFAVQQGEQGIKNNLAALGLKGSGAALKALTRFRTGLANQEYGKYLGNIANIAGMGQGQSQSLGNLGAAVGNGQISGALGLGSNLMQGASAIGNAFQNAGAARASGYVGQANAFSNALSGATNNIGNALGMMAYMPRGNALGAFPAAPGGLY